jgi:SnoaL-like domain
MLTMTDPIGISRRRFAVAAATAVMASAATNATEAGATGGRDARVPADDRLDLIELMARYAWAYDTNDAPGFAATFTQDGVLEVFGNELARGRDTMSAFLDSAVKMRGEHGWQHRTDHHVFQNFDGQRCTVYSYYLMPESDAAGGNVQVRAMGYYVSHCLKTKGRWLFQKREVVRWNGKSPWLTASA